MAPFALVRMCLGEVGKRRVPGQGGDTVLSPQCIVLVEHGGLEGVVVKEEVVVVVLDLGDGGVVGDADKAGVDSEGEGREEEGEEKEEEDKERRHGL